MNVRANSHPISRRQALARLGCGFGSLAFAAMAASGSPAGPGLLSPRPTLLRARAKRMIFLFMQGGPSQVDTFDYKPALDRLDGKRHSFDDARSIAKTGAWGTEQRILRSPWAFARHGQCGQWVSDLFPHTARHVDRLCLLHGMHTEGVAHGPATLFLHCGSTNFVRPSIGSWVSYGLGTENENLPAFVSLAPSLGNGGPRNWGSAFLPPVHQGTALGSAGRPPADITFRSLPSPGADPAARQRHFDLLRSLNAEQARNAAADPAVEAALHSYELAWRMQSHAPAILDLSQESADTLALYGIGEKGTDEFGRQCLAARRLCESGVRFVQVTYGDNTANPRWDQHSDLPKHAIHAQATDKPVAGLLEDLARRGLLDDTLVWWGAEFGRTPYAQDNGTGRDHNPGGFTTWLAGAGVRPGIAYGATDELGHLAVDGRVHMHDLHATLLHLLGLDHELLTFRHEGREHRLTDVHGDVVRSILA
jgi:hypothetical protein